MDGFATTPLIVGYTTGTANQWLLSTSGTDTDNLNSLGASGTVTYGPVTDTATTPVTKQAATFDGTTGTLTSAQSALNTTQSYTVSAWVDLAHTTSFATAVSQEDATGTVSSFYLQYSAGDGGWAFVSPSTDSPSAASYPRAVDPNPVALNTWTNLVGVYDATSHTMSLYVNGTLVGAALNATPWNATGDLHIASADGNNFFPGSIADVRTFPTALTSGQIAQLQTTP